MSLYAWSSAMRPKLWKVWFLGVFALLLNIAALISLGRNFGLDYIAFYRAGSLVHTGHSSLLYNLQDTQNYDRELAQDKHLNLGNTYGAYFNPPFFAWLFAPMVGLGYWKSMIIWEIFNFLCAAGAVAMLCRIIPPQYDSDPNVEPHRDWKDWALVPAFIVVSYPFIQTIGHAQNTFLSLLLMTWAVVAWRGGRTFYAGIAAGLLVYKPQLAAVLLLAMVVTLGWRALAGAALSIGILVAINIFTLPGTLPDYIHHLAPNTQTMLATHPYLWERHATLNGFWHLSLNQMKGLFPSMQPEYLAVVSAVPLGFGLLLSIWRNRSAYYRDRVIAAVITTAPLLMPYYLDYDLLLLAIPAVLLSAEIVDHDSAKAMPKRDVWVIFLWGLFFALLLGNAPLTKLIQLNLSVPLLVLISSLMIVRSLKIIPGLNSSSELNSPMTSFQWPTAAAS